jgi:flagellar motility protein MotE (MotC chaperone)
MMRLARELRVLPIVVFAAACLLVLKLVGLAVDGRYIFAPFSNAEPPIADVDFVTRVETTTAAPAPAPKSWAQEIFSFPDATGSSAPAKAPEKTPEVKKPAEPPLGQPDGKVVPVDGPRQLTPGERAVLERLQERRQELDARAREIEIRENLLKAAEKRLEARAVDIKNSEGGSGQKKEEAEAARFKSIVTMFENMKPKDAAKIFDRLDMKILLDVASAFNPRKMSDVMAQMQPENAEKLTVELANRANGGKPSSGPELPKIDGKPNAS